MRRRPNLSASVPNISSSDANTSVYASCTHWTWVEVMPRSSTIAGTATLTIVESTMMSDDREADEDEAEPAPRRGFRHFASVSSNLTFL